MEDDNDDDNYLDNLEWDEMLRTNYVEMIEWALFLRAVFNAKVEEVRDALSPPPPRQPTLTDLLESFMLVDERKHEKSIAYWNESKERGDVNEALKEAKDAVDHARPPGGPSDDLVEQASDAALGAASAVLGKLASVTAPVDAVHVSDKAIDFDNWHLTDIPESYKAPYSELLRNESIVKNIKKARSMLAVIPHGEQGKLKKQPAGTMAWTRYDEKGTEGWMYVEPFNGEYGQWCQNEIKTQYDAAKARADEVDADPLATPAQKMQARVPMRQLSAAYAAMRQEGLPSAINTYDGTVLTWCSGLAAPGRLKEIFYWASQDPNVYKAMYLCGFLYQGTPTDGIYQVVSLKKVPLVYYRTNYASEDARDPNNPNKIKYPKGTRDMADYKVLQTFVDQIELVYLLILLARDPLTRKTIFDANLGVLLGMARLGSPEKIATEALYVFIAEVKHNWFNASPGDMVDWARRRFTPAEAALPWPSEEHDWAVAKGVFRFILRHVQQGAWNAAVAQLKAKVRKEGKKMFPYAEALDFQTVVNRVVYSFDRLVDNYWKPMQTGIGPRKFKPHMIDQSTLSAPNVPSGSVADFPPLATSVPRATDDVIVYGKNASYNIGSNAQCDFIFTDTQFKLMGFDESGNVVLARGPNGPTWTVTTEGVQVP
jgi:hypothetical protein